MEITFGLDISHHQPLSLDLAQCRRDGCEFVFLKATEGSGFVDSEFRANLTEARLAGLLVAAYHYQRDGVSAAAQVAHISRVVPKDVPVIPDVEHGSGGVALTRAIVAGLRDRGYHVPLSYIPRWYWQQLGEPSLAGLPPLWSSRYPDMVVGTLADEWADVPGHYWQGYGGLPVHVLQFTSSAAIGGYAPLDANAYRGTRAQLAAQLGATGGGGSAPGSNQEDDDMATCTLTFPAGEKLSRTIPLAGLPPYVYFFIEGQHEQVVLHAVDFVKKTDTKTREPSYVPGTHVGDWEVLGGRPGPWKPDGHIAEAKKKGAVGMQIIYSSNVPFVVHVG